MMMLRTMVAGAVLALATVGAWSKLPPPTEEQKAKAEEAKAKAAETAKKDGEALARAQDQVAERYIKLMKEKGIEVKPTPVAPPAAAPVAAAPAQAPQQAAAPVGRK